MKTFLTTFLFSALSLLVQAQVPSGLSGNWINEATNEWDYGFFEKFVIYNTDFWEYKSIKEKGEKVIIVLQKDGQVVSLEIKMDKDSSLLIKQNKGKVQVYNKMGKQYPTYKIADLSVFPKAAFSQDSATIIGYYHNYNKAFELLEEIPKQLKDQFGRRYFTISINDFIIGDEIEYISNFDSLGRFEIKVPLMNTQQAYTDWGRLTKLIVLEPGQRIFLFANMLDVLPRESDGGMEGFNKRNKEILFMGMNSRLNNELLQYKQRIADRHEEGGKAMDFLRLKEESYNKSIEHLNDYIKSYPTVSEKFKFYMSGYYKYNFLYSLMQNRFNLNRRNGERFPEEYMDYVNNLFSLSDQQNYTLFREFKTVLTDYIGYINDGVLYKGTTASFENAAKELEKEGKLTSEIAKLIKEFNDFSKLIEQEADPAKRAEIASSQSAIDMLEAINNNDLIMNAIQNSSIKNYFKLIFETSDSILVTEPVLKELWVSSLYHGQFENTRQPLSVGEMEIFDKYINSPYFRKKLLEENNYYADIQKQDIGYKESLKDTRHLENIYDAASLFNKLIEPYKGKIIYIDFWGTWCGPCRDNMKLMTDIKKEFEGKDIIYMYFANNSPEQSWHNFIKEMSLFGPNVVHYRLSNKQESLLENHFSVSSFPTYMIVDKEGNVNKKAPSPNERERLITIINQL